jgi:hypothetical protein
LLTVGKQALKVTPGTEYSLISGDHHASNIPTAFSDIESLHAGGVDLGP